VINVLKSSDPMNPKVREEEDRRLARAIQENSSEVKNYIDPSLLEWYGEDAKKGINTITFRKLQINILAPLGKRLNPENKTKLFVKIGFSKNGSVCAVKSSDTGFRAVKDIRSTAVKVNKVKGIIELFKMRGWPEVCDAEAHWDEQGQMVVVRRPGK